MTPIEMKELYNKAIAVINSCKTIDQLECAGKYAQFAINKIEFDLQGNTYIHRKNMVFNIVNNLNDLLKTKRKIIQISR
jgi:hypothetical protein